MKIGIVGLPNVGKSTLFKALTKKEVDISNYPFCTIDPNVGVVAMPDERLEKIEELIKPEKIVPATVEFVDIAGLVKGAHEGQGLGNQFLSFIYSVDALAITLRCFKDPEIIHVEKSIDPARDLDIIKNELLKKDEEILNHLKNSKNKEPAATATALLSEKPTIYICNIKSGAENIELPSCHLKMDFKLELEISEMPDEELKEMGLKSGLGDLLKAAYKILDLITFYTIKGGEELRATPLKHGLLAPQAGGKIHSDFEEKFIRAQVIGFDKFTEAGGWQKSKEKGWLRTEGKDYIVQDGDIIEFKI